MKKILLVGYFGANNLGDELLLDSCLNLIHEVLGESQELFEISVLAQNKKQNQDLYKSKILKIFDKFNLFDLLKSIHSNNYIILAGGSVFQDSSSFKSLLYYSLVCFLTKIFGKKLIFFSQGFGLFKTKLAEFITKICLKLAHKISIRDGKYNKLFINSCKLKNTEILEVKDLVWTNNSIKFNNNFNKNNSSKNLIISLRNSHSEYITENLIINFILNISQTLSSLENIKNIQILVFSQSDIYISRLLAELILKQEKNFQVEIINIINISNIHEINNLNLSKNSIALCMRFHACLFCLKNNITCIPLSYDPKVSSLSEELQLEYFNLENNLLNFNTKELESILKNFLLSNSPNKYTEIIQKTETETRLQALNFLRSCF